ncbi:unnamed protein product [Polarella glacialis]|uniref:DNA-(apurinic or apyrimidinic site) endonuclease n=1 Tax=Polarella glacialis TaxID=89957 RepID=A0A813GRK4_POLGL|nr:unnamed protein product [Polarella glacialis]CAE8651100.1 unnamed protein product [Polarella glacialis]
MPPKAFSKSLKSANCVTGQTRDLDLEDEPAPAPKGKRRAAAKAKVTPQKRPATADAPRSKRKAAQPVAEEAAEAEAEEPSEKKARTKKPKPEGPYTCFKEQGSIPEPKLRKIVETVPKGRTRLGVLCWNVGGLRAFVKDDAKKANFQTAIEQANPDVVGLLEHKLQEGDKEGAIDALLEALPGYEVGAINYSTAKKGYSGALMLLRKGLNVIKVTPEDLPSAADEGRMVVAEFEELFVVLCYVPNSGDGLKRLSERLEKWDVQLRERLAELGGGKKKKAVLLIGDLNVAHQDKDIWNVEAPHVPKSAGTTPQERESFAKLLQSGFVDGFSRSNPEALGAFTFWSVRAGNRKTNRGLRLDYVLASKNMVAESADYKGPLLVDTFHLPGLAPQGDHCPVGAVVAL